VNLTSNDFVKITCTSNVHSSQSPYAFCDKSHFILSIIHTYVQCGCAKILTQFINSNKSEEKKPSHYCCESYIKRCHLHKILLRREGMLSYLNQFDEKITLRGFIIMIISYFKTKSRLEMSLLRFLIVSTQHISCHSIDILQYQK